MKTNTMKGKLLILGIMMLVILQASSVLGLVGLDISLSKYDPYPATPGQTVKVWLLVQNTGDSDAKDVNIELVPQPPFTLYNQDSALKNISILGAGKDYLIDYTLKVDNNAVQGTNSLKIIYSHSASSGAQEKNLDISVQTKDATLTIDGVKVDPQEIIPGSDGKVTITVKNDAPSLMTDLSLKLQLQAIVGGVLVDLPFAPIDSGAEQKIYQIDPGQTADFTYTIKAYPDAVSKVYKIPFTLTYYDSLGTQNNKTDFIGVVVNSAPEIAVLIDKTDLTTQMRTGSATLKIINKGLSDVKFLNVIIQKSNDFDLLSNSDTNYVGNLVSDDYQTVDYTMDIKSSKNTVAIPVTLQYRDSNNNYYEKNINVSLNLIDSGKLNGGNGGAGSTWVVIIIILLIVGGVWYYFRRKAKKNKKGQYYQ
jgi:LPXTG-motif cell wall-anchored protein